MAARNLRDVHEITSINAAKLKKTLSLLKLQPRRLVAQGLAPRRLLKASREAKKNSAAAAESKTPPTQGSNNDTVSTNGKEEAEAAQWTLLSVDGDKVENADTRDVDGEAMDVTTEDALQEVVAGDNNKSSITGDLRSQVEGKQNDGGNIENNAAGCSGADNTNGNAKGNPASRAPINAALVAGGVKIRQRETRPLLRALGVKPVRLVRLGLVDREALAVVTARSANRVKIHGPRGGRLHRGGGTPGYERGNTAAPAGCGRMRLRRVGVGGTGRGQPRGSPHVHPRAEMPLYARRPGHHDGGPMRVHAPPGTCAAQAERPIL